MHHIHDLNVSKLVKLSMSVSGWVGLILAQRCYTECFINYSSSFTDGPYITLSNQTEQIVIAGDSTLLLCGTGLHSNPQASVKWHKPDGTTIKPHNHIVDYFVHDGPEYVNVNISSVSESDEGLWSCEISVMDNDADQSDEDVNDKPMNNGSDSITITFEIHLIVLCKLLLCHCYMCCDTDIAL